MRSNWTPMQSWAGPRALRYDLSAYSLLPGCPGVKRLFPGADQKKLIQFRFNRVHVDCCTLRLGTLHSTTTMPRRWLRGKEVSRWWWRGWGGTGRLQGSSRRDAGRLRICREAYRGTSLKKIEPPYDPTVGPCPGPYWGPRGMGVFLSARYPCRHDGDCDGGRHRGRGGGEVQGRESRRLAQARKSSQLYAAAPRL
jgi:hypothetical protein